MLGFSEVSRSRYAPPERPPLVKICGIMREADALYAASLGADMIGLVFAPSKRRVTCEVAAGIVSCVLLFENRPLVVGVFVNEDAPVIELTAKSTKLDIIQLSGDETPEQVARIARPFPVIKALRFAPGTSDVEAMKICEDYLTSAPEGRVKLLVDTYRQGSYGGTGETADWPLAAMLAARYPVILAGGLNAANVDDAVRSVRPLGVDVSSGVEHDGQKDSILIEAFISAARRSSSHVLLGKEL